MSQEAAIQLEQYNLFLLRHLIAGIFCFSIFSIVVMYSYNQGHTERVLSSTTSMFCTVIFGLQHVWIDLEKAQLAIKNKIVFFCIVTFSLNLHH